VSSLFEALSFGAKGDAVRVQPVRKRVRIGRIRATGPAPPFQPGANSELQRIQRNAVNALFDRFGLPWIPPEFLVLLPHYPSPVNALRRFCYEYGINVQGLRVRDSEVIELFRQVVGMLLELGVMRESLPELNRIKILELMQKGQHESAEELFGVCQTLIGVLREAADGMVQFPRYAEFIKELGPFLADCSVLTADDAKDALLLHETFRGLWMKFASVTKNLDGVFTWLMENWPDNAWGEEYAPAADGMVDAKEGIERQLREEFFDPLDEDAGIPFLLRELGAIETDALKLVEMVKVSATSGWAGFSYEEPLETRLGRWYAALELLDFPKDAVPTAKEVSRVFRVRAMPHHDDRWATLEMTDPVRIGHQEMFLILNNAGETLKKGKPA